ncbi:MAG: hypothetical protein JWM87_120 [Candidatus Eremiobacteraeota bacterium]|nr:hypothetical protein [Candidatus Eremiobacteraeota bacterium]
MKEAVRELLTRALEAVDRAATALPDTPEGREQLVVALGVARRSIRAALISIADSGQENPTTLLRYFESAEFVDRHDVGSQVWYVIVPLPISHRLEATMLLREATPSLLKLILETINEGHLDDPWMHPGDYDWTEHPTFAEVSVVRPRRRRPQSLVVNVDGVIAVRDSTAVRGHYPVSVYQAMLETTLAFAYRFYQAFDLRTNQLAVQTYMLDGRGLKMDILRGAASAWYRFPDDSSTIAIPPEPILITTEALREPAPVVAAALAAISAAGIMESSASRDEDADRFGR